MHNTRNVTFGPIDRSRTSIHHHQDNGLPCGIDSLQQFLLPAAQVQTSTGILLAHCLLVTSQHQNGHIRFLGQGNRLIYHCLFVLVQRHVVEFAFREVLVYNVSSFCIAHIRIGQVLLDALIDRLDRSVGRTITANQIIHLGRIRTYYGYPLRILGKRQDVILILQQDDRL